MSKKIDIEIIYPAVTWDEVAQKPTSFIPSEHTQDISTINNLQDELDNKADSSILADVATSGSYNDLENTPSIPDSLSDLSDDNTHRTVTDTEKSTWNSKQDALGYTPENTANKENTTLDTSITKYPTNNLVKTNLDLKVDKITGKGLSENDLTDGLKSNYDTAYTNNHTHNNKLLLDNIGSIFTLTYSGEKVIQKTYSDGNYMIISYNLDDTINQKKYYLNDDTLYKTITAQYQDDIFIGWI